MPIVSISLTNDFLKEMDQLHSSEGFSGRSELIRAGIRSLMNQKIDKITKTSLHYKLDAKKCVDLLIVDGSAKDVKELMRRFQVSGEVDNIKLVKT